jgi:hypothetical protein
MPVRPTALTPQRAKVLKVEIELTGQRHFNDLQRVVAGHPTAATMSGLRPSFCDSSLVCGPPPCTSTMRDAQVDQQGDLFGQFQRRFFVVQLRSPILKNEGLVLVAADIGATRV